MRVKINLAWIAGALALLLMGAHAFAAPPIEQPPKTSYMPVSYTHLTLPTKRIV